MSLRLERKRPDTKCGIYIPFIQKIKSYETPHYLILTSTLEENNGIRIEPTFIEFDDESSLYFANVRAGDFKQRWWAIHNSLCDCEEW